MKTETIDDCGPAFPTKREYQTEFGPEYEQVEGMSLRDWFAGQALAGMLSYGENNFSRAALNSYAFADAMILARKGAKP